MVHAGREHYPAKMRRVDDEDTGDESERDELAVEQHAVPQERDEEIELDRDHDREPHLRLLELTRVARARSGEPLSHALEHRLSLP